MTSTEPKAGYEEVFTVTDYHDGPRQGVANFQNEPHFYDCILSSQVDGYTDLYQLTPISREFLELVKESWEIWSRWELAFHTGCTTIETHPALPQDRGRHEEIRAVLDTVLATDSNRCFIRAGTFAGNRDPNLPNGVKGRFYVKWTEASPEALR